MVMQCCQNPMAPDVAQQGHFRQRYSKNDAHTSLLSNPKDKNQITRCLTVVSYTLTCGESISIIQKIFQLALFEKKFF